jgi:hypothetical protein
MTAIQESVSTSEIASAALARVGEEIVASGKSGRAIHVSSKCYQTPATFFPGSETETLSHRTSNSALSRYLSHVCTLQRSHQREICIMWFSRCVHYAIFPSLSPPVILKRNSTHFRLGFHHQCYTTWRKHQVTDAKDFICPPPHLLNVKRFLPLKERILCTRSRNFRAGLIVAEWGFRRKFYGRTYGISKTVSLREKCWSVSSYFTLCYWIRNGSVALPASAN